VREIKREIKREQREREEERARVRGTDSASERERVRVKERQATPPGLPCEADRAPETCRGGESECE
jgi:hypothetical protein